MTSTPSGGDVPPGTCPTCGAENTPGSRFCERCGTRLPPSTREATGPTPAPSTEATLTFDRLPDLGTRSEHEAPTPSVSQPSPSAAPPPTAAETDERTATEREASAPSSRDAPTVSFELPTLPTPLSDEERNAPTVAFELPELAATDDAASTDVQAASPATAEDPFQPERAPAPEQPERANWNYQPWKPQKLEEQSAVQAAPEGQGETRRSITFPAPANAPRPDDPANQGAAPPQPPPAAQQPTPYPQQGMGGYPPPQAPGWYGPPPGAPAPQGNIT
ncbi:MAG TPA: zinc ribbon domain-containing protein, partial [Thermomicrobiales bacterium]